MEYLSDRLVEPEDFYEVFPWDTLTTKSQNTLQRAIERSDVWRTSELNGFSFDLLSKISIEDLNDARFIGPARAQELLQELVIVFQNYASKSELDSSLNIASKIISTNSLDILAKLTVDKDLNAYLRRIGSAESLATYQRDALLEELLPVKNPLKRIMLITDCP